MNIEKRAEREEKSGDTFPSLQSQQNKNSSIQMISLSQRNSCQFYVNNQSNISFYFSKNNDFVIFGGMDL